MEEFISKDFVKKMDKLKKDWITVCVCVCANVIGIDKYYLRYS